MTALFTLLALLCAAALAVIDWAAWPVSWIAAGAFIAMAYAAAPKEKNHANQETKKSPAHPPDKA